MIRNTHSLLRNCKRLKNAIVVAGVASILALSSSLAVAAPIANASFAVGGGGFSLPAGANLGNTDAIYMTGGYSVTTADPGINVNLFESVGLQSLLPGELNISTFTPITNFLTLGAGPTAVSVDLTGLNYVQQTGPIPGFINLAFDATVNAAGYDPTSGSLTLTGTSSDNQSFGLAVTTSASSTTTNNVPEPMSIALLGLGLVGMFAMARRRTASALAAIA